ncbi:MAG: fliL [Rhodospirillales bacterium]|jgi:flagellar FliL protein|nr:fliL [Rhodospirillales bacterium]
MADDDFEDADDAEGGGGEEQSGGGGGKKKLFIIIGAVVVVLLGAGAGVYFSGLLDPFLGKKEVAEGEGAESGDKQAPKGPAGPSVFFDMPEMIVTLNTAQRKTAFLKIRVALEVARADEIPKIQAVMPRIVDNFQVYLRELRVEDLKGSAGMYRLREELLTRVKAAAAPAKVNAVLFKEMLIQ